MVTLEQIELTLRNNKNSFQTKNIDYNCTAISFLRLKIPYKNCKSIISGAEHDQLFLCDLDVVYEFLNENDLAILADCNVCYSAEYKCLFLFV